MSSKVQWGKILPVFMSFIVMGFVDIVGGSTGYIQKDFDLLDNQAQFIPSMVFCMAYLLFVSLYKKESLPAESWAVSVE